MSTPQLNRLEEFKSALANYHISKQSQDVLKDTKLVLLTAPTAGGRNTIIDELLKTGDYHFIVSDTTRPKRINNGALERDGVEYWFRTEEEVLDDIRNGNYLEAELIHQQQVSGISIRELEAAVEEGRIPINEVDLGGVMAVAKAKPDTVSIIVLPPSFEEWQRRLKGRGHMHVVEYRRRMQTALRIFTEATAQDYFRLIVNDDVKRAAQQIDKLAKTGHVDPEEQERGRKLAEHFREETEKLLKSLD